MPSNCNCNQPSIIEEKLNDLRVYLENLEGVTGWTTKYLTFDTNMYPITAEITIDFDARIL